MQRLVPFHLEDGVSQSRFAVVYLPGRSRNRFPASCVAIAISMEAAREAADASKRRYAAEVLGPSRSSEGQALYYLIRWL